MATTEGTQLTDCEGTGIPVAPVAAAGEAGAWHVSHMVAMSCKKCAATPLYLLDLTPPPTATALASSASVRGDGRGARASAAAALAAGAAASAAVTSPLPSLAAVAESGRRAVSTGGTPAVRRVYAVDARLTHGWTAAVGSAPPAVRAALAAVVLPVPVHVLPWCGAAAAAAAMPATLRAHAFERLPHPSLSAAPAPAAAVVPAPAAVVSVPVAPAPDASPAGPPPAGADRPVFATPEPFVTSRRGGRAGALAAGAAAAAPVGGIRARGAARSIASDAVAAATAVAQGGAPPSDGAPLATVEETGRAAMRGAPDSAGGLSYPHSALSGVSTPFSVGTSISARQGGGGGGGGVLFGGRPASWVGGGGGSRAGGGSRGGGSGGDALRAFSSDADAGVFASVVPAREYRDRDLWAARYRSGAGLLLVSPPHSPVHGGASGGGGGNGAAAPPQVPPSTPPPAGEVSTADVYGYLHDGLYGVSAAHAPPPAPLDQLGYGSGTELAGARLARLERGAVAAYQYGLGSPAPTARPGRASGSGSRASSSAWGSASRLSGGGGGGGGGGGSGAFSGYVGGGSGDRSRYLVAPPVASSTGGSSGPTGGGGGGGGGGGSWRGSSDSVDGTGGPRRRVKPADGRDGVTAVSGGGGGAGGTAAAAAVTAAATSSLVVPTTGVLAPLIPLPALDASLLAGRASSFDGAADGADTSGGGVSYSVVGGPSAAWARPSSRACDAPAPAAGGTALPGAACVSLHAASPLSAASTLSSHTTGRASAASSLPPAAPARGVASDDPSAVMV